MNYRAPRKTQHNDIRGVRKGFSGHIEKPQRDGGLGEGT